MNEKRIEELEYKVEDLVSEMRKLQDNLGFAERELERLENELCDKEELTSAVREIQVDLQRTFPKLTFYRSV